MDLPVDKHQVVMNSPEEKKWQLVRDNTRRTRQQPPNGYLCKLRQVIEATSLDAAKKARKRATDSSTIQALQGLEISLRTNNIRYLTFSQAVLSIIVCNLGCLTLLGGCRDMLLKFLLQLCKPLPSLYVG